MAENWVLLLVGGGMVAMHLFGHKGHGGRKKDETRDSNTADTPTGITGKHTDPVCGKEVDPNLGYGMMYKSRLVRFCSRECLDRFEADPVAYVARQTET